MLVLYQPGQTPLHFAAEEGHTAAARLLVSAGASFAARYTSGEMVASKPV